MAKNTSGSAPSLSSRHVNLLVDIEDCVALSISFFVGDVIFTSFNWFHILDMVDKSNAVIICCGKNGWLWFLQFI